MSEIKVKIKGYENSEFDEVIELIESIKKRRSMNFGFETEIK